METPDNFVFQLIGANHTGKTVLEKRFIADWRSVRSDIVNDRNDPRYGQRKYRVIAFDPKLQLRGLADQFIRPHKHWAVELNNQKIKNCLIVLDDYKTLLPDYKFSAGMFELFASRWHYNIDFLISCHSPGHVIENLITYITKYYIFHTKDIEKYREKMPDTPQLENIAKTINRYTAIYGLGKHPLDKDFKGQKFPYAVFDTTKQEAIPDFYNFSQPFTF
jgi:hypothetical protein